MENSMEIQTFKIEREEVKEGRRHQRLARTDILRAFVANVSPSGGENELHKHPVDDAAWIVLEGKAEFYGENDQPIGSFGKMEGVLIPRDTPYWFDNPGPEQLVILRIAAIDKAKGPSQRVSLDSTKASPYKPSEA